MNMNKGPDKPDKGDKKYAPTHHSGIPEPLRPFSRSAAKGGEQRKSGLSGAFIHMREAPLPDHTPIMDKPDEHLEAQNNLTGRPAKQKGRKGKTKKSARSPKRRRKKRIAALVILLLLLGAAACSAVVFRVERIEVTGNVDLKAESVISQSGITTGSHMFFIDIGKAVYNLERNPYIEVVQIKRAYPSDVEIVIRERKATAAIVLVGSNVVIDNEGHVLAIESADAHQGLTKVHGMSAAGYELNQKIGSYGDFHSKTLVDILNALISCELLSKTESIDVSNALSVRLIMDNGLNVRLGQPSSIEAKLNNLAKVIDQISEEKAQGGVLYLSEESAVFSPYESGGETGEGGQDQDGENEPPPTDEPGNT